MAQIGRPRGLIDYATARRLRARSGAASAPTPVLKTLLRPRTIVYFAALGRRSASPCCSRSARAPGSTSAVQQDRNPLYVRLSDGRSATPIRIKIRNMEAARAPSRSALEGLPGALMWTEADEPRAGGAQRAHRPCRADQVAQGALFVVVAPAQGAARQDFTFTVRALDARRRRRTATAPVSSGRRKSNERRHASAPALSPAGTWPTILVAFFGVVIAVNLIMASFASATFGGTGRRQQLCREPEVQRLAGRGARAKRRSAGRSTRRAGRTSG